MKHYVIYLFFFWLPVHHSELGLIGATAANSQFEVNKQKHEYLIFTKHTKSQYGCAISTHSVIIFAFLHLANALIISDLLSLTSHLDCVLCMTNSVQLHLYNFPEGHLWNITCNIKGPCKYFKQRTFTQRNLLNLLLRCFALQSYLHSPLQKKKIMREDHH